MVFLIALFIAWAIVVLPSARKARWTGPWMSARRYRASMMLVAPRTGRQIRRAERRPVDPKVLRARTRRLEIAVFLGAGAISAFMVAGLADRRAAWPVAGIFTALLLMYTAAMVEADRRKMARRVAARRLAREVLVEAPTEPGFAEAV
jgi:hypothetical protein